MKDTNNYPNYIGVEADTISSLKIKLKYTGDSEKTAIVNEGSLVSIGHVINKNGVLSYALTMGIVKKIGMDPQTRYVNHTDSLNVCIANPYYLVVDKSNTYASDIENIYIRDIRDIMVGPMAEGNFAKGEQSGPILPELNDANKDMYDGRFFYLTQEMVVEEIQVTQPEQVPSNVVMSIGLYYCINGEWIEVTTSDWAHSSPLISLVSVKADDHGNEIAADYSNAIYILRDEVIVRGESIDGKVFTGGRGHIVGGITYDAEASNFGFEVLGKLVHYQLNLRKVSLPIDEVTPTDGTSDITYKEAILTLGDMYQEDIDRIIPEFDSPIMTGRVQAVDKYYNIYHRINTDGKLVLHYPNIAGITDIDIVGEYITKCLNI